MRCRVEAASSFYREAHSQSLRFNISPGMGPSPRWLQLIRHGRRSGISAIATTVLWHLAVYFVTVAVAVVGSIVAGMSVQRWETGW